MLLSSLPMEDRSSYITSLSRATRDVMNEEGRKLEVEMDPRVWRKLPQGLMDRVMAFLPPPSFFRFRSVCRRFYSLLFSNTFLELHLRLSPRFDWFIFFHHKPPIYVYPHTCSSSSSSTTTTTTSDLSNCYLLNPKEGRWHRVPFEKEGVVPEMTRGGSCYSPAATSGGLVCLVEEGPGLKRLVLWNPLTRVAGQLPVTTTTPRLFPSVGLAVGHSSFTVQVAGDDMVSPFAVKNLTSEGFHVDGVAGGFCSTVAPLPRLCNLESGRMVFVSGKFYCMNYSPFSILAYDLASNEWSKIQAPMRRFLRSPSLVECEGKVILVAMVEKSKLNVPRSVRLWELQQPGGKVWMELERMPQKMYAEFMEAEVGKGFECVGQGSFVVLTMKGVEEMLLFELTTKVWRWLPPCPFFGEGCDSSSSLRGFGFEPQLATPAIGLVDSSMLSFQPFTVG